MGIWTDEKIERELRTITGALGSFPGASELRQLGRNDLCCAVTKAGGLLAWSERLCLQRKHSDSDTGWDGEFAVMDLFKAQGIECVRADRVKSPFDLTAAGVLRIDVKSARGAKYGKTEYPAWFYRIGKVPQSDLIVFYQLDTGKFYGLPWWMCPTTNISICDSGGKYAEFLNNWRLVRGMIGMRMAERAIVTKQPLATVA